VVSSTFWIEKHQKKTLLLNVPLKSSTPPEISTSKSPSLSHSFPFPFFLIFGLVVAGDPENKILKKGGGDGFLPFGFKRTTAAAHAAGTAVGGDG